MLFLALNRIHSDNTSLGRNLTSIPANCYSFRTTDFELFFGLFSSLIAFAYRAHGDC